MIQLPEIFQESQFVEATIVQINKDLLGLTECNILIGQNYHLSQILPAIINELILVLKELLRRTPEQLSQFIYRVDLRENRYFDSLQKDPSLHDLAYQIIEREAQKVFLRKKFSI